MGAAWPWQSMLASKRTARDRCQGNGVRCLFPRIALSLLILIRGMAAVSAQPTGPARRVGFFWIGTPDGGPAALLARADEVIE